jgi:gas vesicle protein
MLLAPRSGHELRETITHKIDEGRHMIEEQGGIRGLVDKGVEKGRNVAEIGRRRVNEAVEQGRTRLNESIEAGKTEYRNQQNRDFSGM